MIPKWTGGQSYSPSVTKTRRTPDVQQWFDRRTFTHLKPDAGLLAEMKRALDLRISVCLPALNEGGTVGAICEAIRLEMIAAHDLVDELVVMDSGSSIERLSLPMPTARPCSGRRMFCLTSGRFQEREKLSGRASRS
jgi:hypothetical protein